MTLFEKFFQLPDFDHQVVGSGSCRDLHLLERSAFLRHPLLLFLLGSFVSVLVETHEPSDGGFRRRHDLDEVDPRFHEGEGFLALQNAEIVPLLIDDPQFKSGYLCVNLHRLIIAFSVHSATFIVKAGKRLTLRWQRHIMVASKSILISEAEMAIAVNSAADLADLQRSLGEPFSPLPRTEEGDKGIETIPPGASQKEGADATETVPPATGQGAEGDKREREGEKRMPEPNWLDWAVSVGDDLRRELAPILLLVSPADCTVVIDGESGSGKEIVAKTIHANSPRRHNPFIAFNCSAVPETLIESEIFGHERGAFTGSDKKTIGKFAAADGGTLFLDEIADMSWSVQTRLLRVLESGEIAVVGSPTSKTVDVRVIAASNQDLCRLVEEKKFREDLFWRLGVVKICVPPLRERPADILFLAKEFLKHCTPRQKGKPFFLSPEAEEVLLSYRWPGNVRQLREVIEAASIFAVGPEISAEDVSRRFLVAQWTRTAVRKEEEAGVDTTRSLEEVMQTAADKAAREYLLELLAECRWNKRQVARRAGRSYKSLLNDIKRLGLKKS